MIEVKGNYAFDIKLGNKQNFITETNFDNFILTSECGGGLPMFALKFKLDNKEILKYLNEGNLISFAYGSSAEKLNKNATNFRIYGEPEITKSGTNAYQVSISGLLDIPNYFNNRVYVSEKLSAAEILNARAKASGLKINKNNITKSTDQQNYVQFGNSDRRFFVDTMMHMDLPKSFPLMAITKDGEFRLLDVKKLVDSTPKWKFANTIKNKNDLAYTGSPIFIHDKSTLTNFWVGYNSSMPVIDITTGEAVSYTEEVKNLLSINKNLPRHVKEEQRLEELNVINDNVHANYWRSFQSNLKHSFIFSRNRLGLNFKNQFKQVEAGDLISYADSEVLENELSNTTLSGNFIVTKSVWTFNANQFAMYSEMCRESFSNIKGEFK